MSAIAFADSQGAARAMVPRVLLPVLSILLFVPILQGIYWPTATGLDVVGYPIGRDFINVWAGPQIAFSEQFWKLFDLRGYYEVAGTLFGHPIPFHNWGYPLFTLIAFWPLAQLPYFAALAVWTFGLFAIFAGVTLSQVDRPVRPFALFLLVLAPACLINTVGGQNGFLSAALLIGGLLLLERRPILAGVLFGLLTYKPHLGLVLPFVLLALGAWRTIAAATITAAALVAISLLVFGLEPWRAYFEVAGQFQMMALQRFQGFSMLMMVSALIGARTFGLSHQAAVVLQIVVALPVLMLAVWAVRQTVDPARRAFVVVSATLLVTPYAFNYDLPALAAVTLWQFAGHRPLTPGRTIVLACAWIMPIAVMYLNNWGLGLAPFALLGVFVIAVRDAAADRRVLAPESPAFRPSLGSGAPA